MIVLHKKTKKEHFIPVESWNKIIEMGWDGQYKVIDSAEFVSKTINLNPKDIEVFEIKLEEKPKPRKKKVVKKETNIDKDE